jgi:O-antigen/teichoic acid export membrane protein
MKSHLFFKGLSWLLILNLLVKPVWIFAIDRQVQNIVGHEVYGTYFALLNLTIVFLFIADAGLSNMITRRISAQQQVNSLQLLQVKAMLLLLYAMFICLTAWLTQIPQWRILLYLILIQVLGSLFLFLRSLLTANQFFKTDSFFSVADKCLMIVLCSCFIYGWWQPISLEIFLQFQTASITLACIFLLALLLKKGLIIKGPKEKIVQIIKWTVPFAVIILLMGMHYRLDAFLLVRIRDEGAMQAGIYATAYRLLDAANMVGYLVASFLVPFVAKNRGDNQLIKNVITQLQHGMLFIAIIITAFAFVFASWIQQTLYYTNNSFNSTVIQLCLAVLPAYYITHIYGSVLTALADFKTFIIILLVSVCINIVLNFLLTPKYGASGSCVAALISQYCCAMGCYFFATRRFSLSRSPKHWLAYLFATVLSVLLFLVLKATIHSVWIILVLIIVLVSIVIITRMKFFKSFYRSFIQKTHA